MAKIVIIVISLFIISPKLLAQTCEANIASAKEFYRCALKADKRLSSLSMRNEERQGRRDEAAQIPNPEVESEFTFTSEKSQNISIVQPIEIGGKRSSRIKIADAENKISFIEDESTVAKIATDLALSLVRYRQIMTRSSLLSKMKGSLQNLTGRLRAKAVRTPEEKTAVSIFSMQKTVLDTQILTLNQELKLVKTNLEASIGRVLKGSETLSSSERREWPPLDSNKVNETFKTRLAVASVERVRGEVELEKSLAWPELSVGPTMEKQDGNETSWGAKVEFTIPLLNTNGGARQRSRAELSRSEAIVSQTRFKEASRVKVYLEQYNDVVKFLKNSPSQKSLKNSIANSLRLFSRGMIQPAAIVESYRSTLETLEAVQEKELIAYQLYWMLRSFSGEVPKEFL